MCKHLKLVMECELSLHISNYTAWTMNYSGLASITCCVTEVRNFYFTLYDATNIAYCL